MLAFGRYVVSAGAASLVDFGVVQSLLLISLLQSGPPFALAIMLGALAGMAVNFTLSRRLVFGQQGRIGRGQVLRFFLISLSTLVLRVVVAFAAMAILSLPPFAGLASLPIDAPATRLAHIVAMGLVTIYSFFAHKHISFAAPPSPPASMAVR